MLPCLTALGELQDSYQFACVNEVDHALGQAIQSMGPRAVLKAIPLQVKGHCRMVLLHNPCVKEDIQSF